MAPKNRGLGRGLSALIPGAGQQDAFENNSGTLDEIEVSVIHPRADQPRVRFDPIALAELVDSIKAQGILQPLLVTPRDGEYQLVAGERRYRAARIAGLVKVPCRILDNLNDQQILEIALVENLQREDLNAVELADGYRRLVEDLGLNQKQVAERVGKDRATVANTLRLLKLPDPILKRIKEGKLSAGHARTILAVDSDVDRVILAEEAIKKGLSVRELERIILKPKKNKNKPVEVKNESVDLHARELEKQVEARLGMKVNINHKGPGGRLIVNYNNLDELDQIMEYFQDKKAGE